MRQSAEVIFGRTGAPRSGKAKDVECVVNHPGNLDAFSSNKGINSAESAADSAEVHKCASKDVMCGYSIPKWGKSSADFTLW